MVVTAQGEILECFEKSIEVERPLKLATALQPVEPIRAIRPIEFFEEVHLSVWFKAVNLTIFTKVQLSIELKQQLAEFQATYLPQLFEV